MVTVPADVKTPSAAGDKQRRIKTAVFIAAVLLIQLGFILSYVGAFHAPKPSGIAVEVVAPASVRSQVVDQLNSLSGAPLDAHAAASSHAALTALRHGTTSGVFTVDATGTTDRLTVASAGGASIATALETLFQQVDASQSRTVSVVDAVPAQAGDARGLTGFYMVTGWLVGGYLLAAVLGILLGTALVGVRAALGRIALFVPYAILSGIGGALVVDQGIGAVTGHFWAIAAVGTLVVLASAMVTVALQSFLGIIGIGISIVVFVVLGNPSAGGAYQPELLPPFWRALSQALPNGAATTALRRIIYFHGERIAGDITLLGAYAAAGILIILLTAIFRARLRRPAAADLSDSGNDVRSASAHVSS